MSSAGRSVAEIAKIVGGALEGSPDVSVRGVAGLHEADAGDLTFLANEKYRGAVAETRASAILVTPGVDCPPRLAVIRVDDPYAALQRVVQLFDPGPPPVEAGVHPTAVVHPEAELAADVAVGPWAVIERGVRIGARTRIGASAYLAPGVQIGEDGYLFPRVYIGRDCRVGDRVILQPGVVIGSDGFGYAPVEGRYHRIPQIGVVVIEDDVEVGANSCIDRATLGETRIGRGTKIDNLVQIAHNVAVSENVVMAAQSGVAGSTKIGSGVQVGGQAGIAGHVRVGDGAKLGAQAGIVGDIAAGSTVSGYPARPHTEVMRASAALRRLPELLRRVRALESNSDQSEKKP
ncbi:MAG: UDP-3-O-(3-hydroxymyristoyl)glucosamine N-acyltransferase [Gemmatimonadetes bacterium]|nr:UDP-3-O-(3-hydroxymyristoyl)glucosamine N-acyltransferase [Gemmatimonadota bacterium]